MRKPITAAAAAVLILVLVVGIAASDEDFNSHSHPDQGLDVLGENAGCLAIGGSGRVTHSHTVGDQGGQHWHCPVTTTDPGDSGSTDPGTDPGSSTTSSTPTPTPIPTPTPLPMIGHTGAATASEMAGDLMLLQRHDQPGVEIEVGIGWISQDGETVIAVGFVRDGDLGQTYAVVRRESDGQVVRLWVAPDSPLVYSVPWPEVLAHYTFPVGVIAVIPLDDQYPWPGQLARRFDGNDDRIFSYDAELAQWRHVPDLATFQALGFYWCDVTAADAEFFTRIVTGAPHPPSDAPASGDYPVCRT